jgi:uncharacterized Zn-finger protein
MGAPPSFAARRPHAAQLGNFELPPPSVHNKYASFSTVNASQSSQASTTVASVGNLLTPPNFPSDGVNPSSGVNTSSAHSSAMPYNGTYIYSPPGQASAQYGYPTASQQQQQHYNSARGTSTIRSNSRQLQGEKVLTPGPGLNPPPYQMNSQQLPPFPPSSTPLGGPSTMAAMPSQEQQSHHMMNSHTPVSSSAPQQSPAHAQEPFHRPPPTPTFYGSQPNTTPQQANFPYSTGPSPTQQSPISAGPHPRMSPAVSQGTMPTQPAQSPHTYQRPYASYMPPAPVFSNVNNPNGQLALVGGVHPGMMGFNSGHAAHAAAGGLPHFLGHAPPQTNDRPFKCDQCPQSFNRNHDLKRHKRIHLAVKPFPCANCVKSFSRKDALKVQSFS